MPPWTPQRKCNLPCKLHVAFGLHLRKHPLFCYTGQAALLQSGNRKEVSALEFLTSILVAVEAGVISHCVCKWLDGHGKGK